MTCKNCIHYFVCYRKSAVPEDYARKCEYYTNNENIVSASTIENIKTEIGSLQEGSNDMIYNLAMNDALKIIDKHMGWRSDAD